LTVKRPSGWSNVENGNENSESMEVENDNGTRTHENPEYHGRLAEIREENHGILEECLVQHV
jgi:hypothetical protein